MRKWIILAAHDEGGSRLTSLTDEEGLYLERVAEIKSASDGEPTDDEISGVLAGFEGMQDGQEVLLLPLDAGIKLNVRQIVEVTWNVTAVT